MWKYVYHNNCFVTLISQKLAWIVLAFLFCRCEDTLNVQNQEHQLVQHYKGEMILNEEELNNVIEQTMKNPPSNYLMALALYQKGLINENEGKELQAFKTYRRVLLALQESDTVDNFLYSALFRNQGKILYNFREYEQAADLYKKAKKFSYAYSEQKGISTEYSIALATTKYSPEEGIQLFLKLKNRVQDNPQRLARIYNQLGQFQKKTMQYDDALKYYHQGLAIAKNREKARLLQGISDLYYRKKDYKKQEEYLLEVLKTPKSNRFIALMDLGECYILQNRREEAKPILEEAAILYGEQRFKRDYIKVFKWLKKVSDDPLFCTERQVQELEKFSDNVSELREMMRTEAMRNVLEKEKAEQEHKAAVARYWRHALIASACLIIIATILLIRRKILRRQLAQILEAGLSGQGL